MKRLYNADHQPAIVDHGLPAVQPGESHDFTDEQVESGISGNWSETPPSSEPELTKAQLVDRAQELGIDVPSGIRKAELADLIARHEDETDSAPEGVDEQPPETAITEPAEPEEGEQ